MLSKILHTLLFIWVVSLCYVYAVEDDPIMLFMELGLILISTFLGIVCVIEKLDHLITKRRLGYDPDKDYDPTAKVEKNIQCNDMLELYKHSDDEWDNLLSKQRQSDSRLIWDREPIGLPKSHGKSRGSNHD